MRGGDIRYVGCVEEETQERVQIFDLTFDWKPLKKFSGSIYLDLNLPRISNFVPKRLDLFIQLFSVWLKKTQIINWLNILRTIDWLSGWRQALKHELSFVSSAWFWDPEQAGGPLGAAHNHKDLPALGVTTAQQNGLILFEMCSDNGDWASLVPINSFNE